MNMHPCAAFLAEFFHSDQAKLIVFVFCFSHPTPWLLKLGDDAGVCPCCSCCFKKHWCDTFNFLQLQKWLMGEKNFNLF